MPRGDGTGPPWGSGQGMRSRGGGRIKGTRAGIGPGGNCVCPNCGAKAPHKQGTPCYSINCPSCGSAMVRE
jgi:hypothetical protein